MTTIGALRDVVTIQQAGAMQDEIGESVPAWTAIAVVRASVRDLIGRELIAAQAVQSLVTTKITIRFRTDVTAAMRIVRGTEVFQIESVLNPSGRANWLELMCIKGAPNA
jgi:SPP1 family predicted phage head-tail adaptor